MLGLQYRLLLPRPAEHAQRALVLLQVPPTPLHSTGLVGTLLLLLHCQAPRPAAAPLSPQPLECVPGEGARAVHRLLLPAPLLPRPRPRHHPRPLHRPRPQPRLPTIELPGGSVGAPQWSRVSLPRPAVFSVSQNRAAAAGQPSVRVKPGAAAEKPDLSTPSLH